MSIKQIPAPVDSFELRMALCRADCAVPTAADDCGVSVFEQATWWAAQSRMWRKYKCDPVPRFSAGKCEALARAAERHVRNIALRCEIVLQRRADGQCARTCGRA